MAGGGGALSVERSKRGKASKRKKMKRVGFHLDMTPLVDITFLLLTFFMFTTTMATPQIMEMSIPPEINEQVEVRESQLFTLLVDEEGDLYYYRANDPVEELDIKDLMNLAIKFNLEEGMENKLITALHVNDEAPYSFVIEILDNLNLAEIDITSEVIQRKDSEGKQIEERERRFTMAPYSEEDAEKVLEFKGEEVTE